MRRADERRRASVMISSSIRWSLAGNQVDGAFLGRHGRLLPRLAGYGVQHLATHPESGGFRWARRYQGQKVAGNPVPGFFWAKMGRKSPTWGLSGRCTRVFDQPG